MFTWIMIGFWVKVLFVINNYFTVMSESKSEDDINFSEMDLIDTILYITMWIELAIIDVLAWPIGIIRNLAVMFKLQPKEERL